MATASDLRAQIARRRATIYQLAAQVGVYPGRLGQMLNERIPMPEDVAERMAQAIEAWGDSTGSCTEGGSATEEKGSEG